MTCIALTGGIGSGKTTVADYFAALGVPIIDADHIAHDLVRPHSPALKQISHAFGADILRPDQSLDRSKLRRFIFSDQKAKQWLEDLLHPLIIDEIEQRLNQETTPYCIVAIPLLIETQSKFSYHFIDRILVVDCPVETQLARCRQRDQISQAQIEAIMKTQATRQQRLQAADDVIENNADLTVLQEAVVQLDQKYRRLTSSAN